MYHHFLICCTTNFSKNCIVAVYLRSNQVAVWSRTMGDVMCDMRLKFQHYVHLFASVFCELCETRDLILSLTFSS